MAISPVDKLTAELAALQDQVQALIHQTSYQIAQNPKQFRRGGAAKIRASERTLLAKIDQLTAESQHFFETGFVEIFRSGAQRGGSGRYAFTPEDTSVIDQISNTAMNDIRVNNELAKRSTKKIMADLSRTDPSKITRKLLQESVGKGMQWRDGRRYGVGAYNKMVTRAAAARAYNSGTILANQRRGTVAFLVSDGNGCGWTYHEDPQEANGMKVSAEDALANLISHPNCVRQFSPTKDKDEPGPVGLKVGRKLAALLPEISGPVAAAGIAGLGLGAEITLNANLRKKLVEVALKANPYRRVFMARMQQIVDELLSRGIAEVYDIATGLPLKVSLETLREDLASYANEAIDGMVDLPEHVRHVLDLGIHETKKVVGDSFENFMEFVGLEREASISSAPIPFIEDLARDFGHNAIKFQPDKWLSIPLPPNSGKFIRFHFPRPPGGSAFGGRLRVTIPQLGQRFFNSRALRIAFQPNRWVKITGTARASWSAFMEEGVHIWDVTRIIPHIRLNPNGLIRAGFSFVDGKLLPSLSAVGKGPLRLFTKLNPGGSISTTVRLVTRGWFNFSVSTNLKLDVIKEAMKNYGLLDLSDFKNFAGIHKQFELARTAVRQQLSNLHWSDFNIRSLAAELHIYGFSVFDIARTFRIKWEDAMTLLNRAKEFMADTLHRASLYYQRVRYGGQVVELSTSLLKRYRNTSEEGLLADLEQLRPRRPTVDELRIQAERRIARGEVLPNETEEQLLARLKRESEDTLVSQQAMWDDVKTTAHMFETRYPRAAQIVLSLKDDAEMQQEGVWAFYNAMNKKIEVNNLFRDNYLKNLSVPGEIVPDGGLFKANVISGHLVKYEDQAGAVVHELGHQMHYGLSTDELAELWSRIQETPGWQKVFEVGRAGNDAEELLTSMSTELLQNAALVERSLSGYATQNVVEFTAEGFGQFMYAPGRGSPIAEAIGKFFDQTYGATAAERSGVTTWHAELLAKYPELTEEGIGPDPAIGLSGPDPEFVRRVYGAVSDFFHPDATTVDLLQEAGMLDGTTSGIPNGLDATPLMPPEQSDWILSVAKKIDSGAIPSALTPAQYLVGVFQDQYGVTAQDVIKAVQALPETPKLADMDAHYFYDYTQKLEQWLKANGTKEGKLVEPFVPLDWAANLLRTTQESAANFGNVAAADRAILKISEKTGYTTAEIRYGMEQVFPQGITDLVIVPWTPEQLSKFVEGATHYADQGVPAWKTFDYHMISGIKWSAKFQQANERYYSVINQIANVLKVGPDKVMEVYETTPAHVDAVMKAINTPGELDSLLQIANDIATDFSGQFISKAPAAAQTAAAGEIAQALVELQVDSTDEIQWLADGITVFITEGASALGLHNAEFSGALFDAFPESFVADHITSIVGSTDPQAAVQAILDKVSVELGIGELLPPATVSVPSDYGIVQAENLMHQWVNQAIPSDLGFMQILSGQLGIPSSDLWDIFAHGNVTNGKDFSTWLTDATLDPQEIVHAVAKMDGIPSTTQLAIDAIQPGLVDDATAALVKNFSLPYGMTPQDVQDFLETRGDNQTKLALFREHLLKEQPETTQDMVIESARELFGINQFDPTPVALAKWDQFFNGGNVEQMSAKFKLVSDRVGLKVEAATNELLTANTISTSDAISYVTKWVGTHQDKNFVVNALASHLGIDQAEFFQLYADVIEIPSSHLTNKTDWFYSTADNKMLSSPLELRKSIGKMRLEMGKKAMAAHSASGSSSTSETMRRRFHGVLVDLSRKWSDFLSHNQDWVDALERYTTNAYHVVNAHLRGQLEPGGAVGNHTAEQTISVKGWGLPEDLKSKFNLEPLFTKAQQGENLTAAEWKRVNDGAAEWASQISTAIRQHDPIPEDITVWRGANPALLPVAPDGTPLADAELVDWELAEPGFASTSISRSFARDWSGHAGGAQRLLMEIHVHKGAKGVAYLHHVSTLTNEWEVLLDRGSRFRILEMKRDPTDPNLRIAILDLIQ